MGVYAVSRNLLGRALRFVAPDPVDRVVLAIGAGALLVGSAVGVAAARLREYRGRELRQLRRRDEIVLGSIDEGIYGLDVDGRVSFVNPAAQTLLGYGAEDLLGRRMHEVVHAARPDGSAYPIDACLIHGPLDGEEPVFTEDVFRRADGTPLSVECTVAPLVDEGRSIGVVVGFRDVAPRLAARRERERYLRLQLADQEHRRIFRELEGALRPVVPPVPGTEVDVTYQPADEGAPTGGDLYDAHLLTDGALHLLVVDVVGKGVRSTRDALSVVHTARALVLGGVPLKDLVAETDRLLVAGHSELMATVLVGRYDPVTGELALAGGGHPPALLVRADGRTEWLEASGRPVGYPLAGSDATVTTLLDPGDTVLLYTDGLVEAQRDIEAGMAALARTARAMRARPVAGFTATLVRQLLGGARTDDTLVIALRRQHPEESERRDADGAAGVSTARDGHRTGGTAGERRGQEDRP